MIWKLLEERGDYIWRRVVLRLDFRFLSLDDDEGPMLVCMTVCLHVYVCAFEKETRDVNALLVILIPACSQSGGIPLGEINHVGEEKQLTHNH